MDNITEWDPEKECVQYTSGPAYNILGVNHVHTQEREQELAIKIINRKVVVSIKSCIFVTC